MERNVFCGTSCLKITRLLNTPIIGRLTAAVDSSSIDMLAGLSKWPILRIPPGFCADAAVDNSNSALAAASTRRPRFIISCLLFITRAVQPAIALAGPFRARAERQRQEATLFRPTGTSFLGEDVSRVVRVGDRCRLFNEGRRSEPPLSPPA